MWIDYSKDWCVLCNSIATKKCRDYHSMCVEMDQQVTGKEISVAISQQDIQKSNGQHTPLCYPVQRLLLKPYQASCNCDGILIREPGIEGWYTGYIDRVARLLLWKWENHQYITPTLCKVWMPEYLLKGD